MIDPIRFRKNLTADMPSPIWPNDTRRLPLPVADPVALHAILTDAYASGFGEMAPFHNWWSTLIEDEEYDPDLLIIAATGSGKPIGLVQGWTSGFIKDLAVTPAWRRKGVGQALLLSIFQAYHLRGAATVDLKVVRGNKVAIDLYRRLGMVEAPL